jgi:outer membrane immunogenic protein
MKRAILGVAAALMLGAAPAVADGVPNKGRIKHTDPAPSWNWTGFYIGGGIGAGAVVHDVTVSESRQPDLLALTLSEGGGNVLSFDGVGGEGIFGTIIVGYDRLIRPGWVAGVFADFDFSGISTDLSIPHYFSASLDHRHSWSIGARLGMLSSPTTLWYAAAGYTQAEFDFSSSEYIHGLSSPTFHGYFVGGGVESLLHGNWSLRLEYRFSQFGSETVFDYDGLRVDLEPSMHTARLLLTYKFGHRD